MLLIFLILYYREFCKKCFFIENAVEIFCIIFFSKFLLKISAKNLYNICYSNVAEISVIKTFVNISVIENFIKNFKLIKNLVEIKISYIACRERFYYTLYYFIIQLKPRMSFDFRTCMD